MAKNTTKRCHWVSQSYLKPFSADADRKRIWRHSKTSGDPELKLIEKVAVRHHLYAPMGPDGRRDDGLERKLSSLERWFGEPIWGVVCNDFPDLTWEPLRKMLALLTATTFVRNPLQFERWKATHVGMRNLYAQVDTPPTHVTLGGRRYEVNPSDWPDFKSAGDEEMKSAWNDYVAGAGDIAPKLLSMRWAVLFCDQPMFVTSDNPVNIIHPSLQFKGLNDPETIVSFPLSPTRILMMDNRHGEPNGAYYPLRHDPAVENLLIWRNAIDHMFSPRDPIQVCMEINDDADRAGFGPAPLSNE